MAIIIFIIGNIVVLLKTKKDGDNKNNRQKESIENTEKKEYQVLVSVRNQNSTNLEEDRRSSMKKGYVVDIHDHKHNWSNIEKNRL